ncbi:Gfo/Idh/MocA family protein [Bacillus solitudinis]|uniref:Gfo/Idh/MocA family protein n=1 Tax=Bacillus solitudinis TaxID=2014074 RepID=UPI000C235F2E|nr:Gfo/Idh/MocA family oxidoreductase [Bacillus solitudinis]
MALEIGIIGTGGFSQLHAGILSEMDGVRMSAFCGTSKEKAGRMAAEFHGAKAYDQITDMLDGIKLDAVYICVPPMAHGEIEAQLIERGIPFFVEKPIGLNLDLPSQIFEKLKKTQVMTAVGYHFRYKDSIQHLKKLLANQNIGMILGQWMGAMPMVPWWRNQQGSGGQFNEQTTHIVDLLRFLGGEIDTVYATFGQQIMQKKVEDTTVADIGTVTLGLKSGVIANLSNTCILPNGVSRIGLSVYTDAGIMDWEPNGIKVNRDGNQTDIDDISNPYEIENEAFIHAIRTGDTSRILSNYQDALMTQRVTTAAIESAQKGILIKC